METNTKPAITMIPTPNATSMIEYGYDSVNKELIVQYVRTGFYRYKNIEQEDFDKIALAESPSKGVRTCAMSKIHVKADESHFVRNKSSK